MMTHDPHAVLGVPPDASFAQIRTAYRALIRRHHPDRCDAPVDRFIEIRRAYEILKKRPPDTEPGQHKCQKAQRVYRPSADPLWASRQAPRAHSVHSRHQPVGRESPPSGPGFPRLSVDIELNPWEAARGGQLALNVPAWATPSSGPTSIQLLIPPGIPHGYRAQLHLGPTDQSDAALEVRIWITP